MAKKPQGPKDASNRIASIILALVVVGGLGGFYVSQGSLDLLGLTEQPALVAQQGESAQEQDAGAKDAALQQADTRPLTFRTAKSAKEHYNKHGKKMGFANVEAYESAAAALVRNPKALHKTEKEDGDDVYYLVDSDEIVFVSKAGYVRTYFKPGGKGYFDRQ